MTIQFHGNGLTVHRSRAEYHLTRAELRKVIDSTQSARDRALLAVMAETGMRRSEVVGLDISDLRLEDNLAVVRQGKGGASRLVPLTDHLIRVLTQNLVMKDSGPVFISRNGGRLSARQLNRVVAKAGHRAGVIHPNPTRTGLTCHLFRHTFARLWKDAGGSIETLSSILGHASQATTMDLYGREGLSDVRTNYKRTMKHISILED